MMRFFSDLDNTLIYSHRHKIPQPRICVEELHGKPQSYMSQKSYNFFLKQKWLNVTPVTTRTYEQYQRLDSVAKSFRWNSALICNGSVLLCDGKEDLQWRKESILLSEKDQEAFEELYSRAYDLYGKDNIVLVDHLMFYIRKNVDQDVYEMLKMCSNPAHLQILKDARKTYCFPTSLNKGSAIKRFLDRTSEAFCLAAGDSSEFDISMAGNVDIFLCPEGFRKKLDIQGKLKICKGYFADAICDELHTIRAGEMVHD